MSQNETPGVHLDEQVAKHETRTTANPTAVIGDDVSTALKRKKDGGSDDETTPPSPPGKEDGKSDDEATPPSPPSPDSSPRASHGEPPKPNEDDLDEEVAKVKVLLADASAKTNVDGNEYITECATVWSVVGFVLTTCHTSIYFAFALTGDPIYQKVRGTQRPGKGSDPLLGVNLYGDMRLLTLLVVNNTKRTTPPMRCSFTLG